METKEPFIELKQRTCPYCNQSSKDVLIHYVDASKNPALFKKVCNGELFKHRCPHCHKETIIDTDMMVIHPQGGYAVLNMPYPSYISSFEDAWKEAKKRNSKLRFRITNRIKQMYEVILIREDGYDDCCMEFFKYHLSSNLQAQGKAVKEIYYLGKNRENLCFSLFERDKKNSVCAIEAMRYQNYETEVKPRMKSCPSFLNPDWIREQATAFPFEKMNSVICDYSLESGGSDALDLIQ